MPRKDNYPSVRIFRNPSLERLTHVQPWTPFAFWIPIIAALHWRALQSDVFDAEGRFLIPFAGLLLWTLLEYLIHRFLFHFPARHPLARRLVYIGHGLHHEHPTDPTRLVMPPAGALILAAVFYLLFHLLLGPFRDATFAFFLTGYLFYDFVHFSVHHFTPRTRLGKRLKKHHMHHHFVDPSNNWGVSSPLWDWIFGTLAR